MSCRIALAVFTYGGVHPETADCITAELLWARENKLPLHYSRVHGDALISRSRSKALSDFLSKTDADVLFMLDHDLSWRTGELLATCLAAHEKKALVSGFYACRAFNAGFAGRLKREAATVRLPANEFHDAEYLPGGFLAIPRVVAEEVLKNGLADDVAVTDPSVALTECLYNDGTPFFDFFRPIVVASSIAPGKNEYLSEDWSFSHRARLASPHRPQLLWAQPLLTHHGEHGFTMRDAMRAEAPASRLVKP